MMLKKRNCATAAVIMFEMNQAMQVQIAGIVHESIVDGPGIRITVFFQGCPHGCVGCHNPQTWDPEGGTAYHVPELIAKLHSNPLEQGVTFSGGEPFSQAEGAALLGAYFKARGLGLWVYTGFLWEKLLGDLAQPGYREPLQSADVIVDGPFRQELKQPGLVFRGSANQRLIKVRESMAAGQVVEWQPERMAF
jgi:anaerobic ribonucleoside-triphosphate reductase activating protein